MKGFEIYILDDEQRPFVCKDPVKFAEFFSKVKNLRVAETKVGKSWVSTVFLMTDHRHIGKGPPLLFETMVFGGPLHGEQYRYSSWDDAETGHKAMVRRVKAALKAQSKNSFASL